LQRIYVDDARPDTDPFDSHACYEWQILVIFDFASRQHLEVKWAINLMGRCPREHSVNAIIYAVSAVTLVLVLIHELHTAYCVWIGIRDFQAAYRIQQRSLPARDKAAAASPGGVSVGHGVSLSAPLMSLSLGSPAPTVGPTPSPTGTVITRKTPSTATPTIVHPGLEPEWRMSATGTGDGTATAVTGDGLESDDAEVILTPFTVLRLLRWCAGEHV
jgi:hypothetical protein